MLRLAERPVLQRLASNEKRRDQASSALRLVTNRLNKKLSRGLPFPPASAPPRAGRKNQNDDAGRAEELDFERVVDSVRSLERQLDPLLHAVRLLETEKEREERALEEDYRTLSTLEANAKSEARNFKDNLRKTHVLVPEQNKDAKDWAVGDEDFKFVPDENVGDGLFKVSKQPSTPYSECLFPRTTNANLFRISRMRSSKRWPVRLAITWRACGTTSNRSRALSRRSERAGPRSRMCCSGTSISRLTRTSCLVKVQESLLRLLYFISSGLLGGCVCMRSMGVLVYWKLWTDILGRSWALLAVLGKTFI